MKKWSLIILVIPILINFSCKNYGKCENITQFLTNGDKKTWTLTKETLNDSVIKYRTLIEIDFFSNYKVNINEPLRKWNLSNDCKILTYEQSHWGGIEEKSFEIFKINDSILILIDTLNILEKRRLEFKCKDK